MKRTSLFFERSKGEKILIGEGRNVVEVEISRIREHNCTVVLRAPSHVRIDRFERRIRRG